uniref:Putative secreted protein n=1 Tax=Anopheles darlingi TaxID=43151 RepID=A0A2M4DGI6_ANODA
MLRHSFRFLFPLPLSFAAQLACTRGRYVRQGRRLFGLRLRFGAALTPHRWLRFFHAHRQRNVKEVFMARRRIVAILAGKGGYERTTKHLLRSEHPLGYLLAIELHHRLARLVDVLLVFAFVQPE